jgi:hypothetical protein
MDGYIHDSKRFIGTDPKQDPAIETANNPAQDKGGVEMPNKVRGGATGTEEALYLLGAGKPYGDCA